jgi:prevent-host-death family protein
MDRVGVRELKASLSRYLGRVRDGETIEITDRGRAVARIVPVGIPEHVASMMSEGRVTWSGTPFAVPSSVHRLRPGPPLTEYLDEDRR